MQQNIQLISSLITWLMTTDTIWRTSETTALGKKYVRGRTLGKTETEHLKGGNQRVDIHQSNPFISQLFLLIATKSQ